MERKERLFYLDFVRTVAVISIVTTHFNARYLYLDPPLPEKAVITTTVSNIYLGDWGVALFFIISGAALMYVYGEKCVIKQFYKKRFLSIYPMFWIAYIVAFWGLSYMNKSILGGGVPKFNFIFTILGFDGLLCENIPTFYVLGEWFLGAIILMYILFPVLRKMVNNRPIITIVGIHMIYFYIVFFYHLSFNPAKLIFTRLPEIVFGMYFVKWRKKVDWKVALTALIVLVLNGVLKPGWSDIMQTTYVGIASFLVLVYLSYFMENRWCQWGAAIISKYSYAIFLVHHVIIGCMMATFDLTTITRLHSYLLFMTISIVIGFMAFLLYHFHSYLMRQLSLVMRGE